MVKTIVKVEGMMCSMCEAHINDVIRRNFDIKKVKSDRKKKQTIIESNEELDKEKIKEVINQTGYDVIGFE